MLAPTTDACRAWDLFITLELQSANMIIRRRGDYEGKKTNEMIPLALCTVIEGKTNDEFDYNDNDV